MRALTVALPLAALVLSSCIVVVGDDDWSMGNAFSYSRGPTGSGVEAEEHRQVDDFAGVRLACSGDLRVEVGSAPGVTVRCDDDLLHHVETYVKRGVLVVDVEGNPRFRAGLVVVATTPSLSQATLSGSGGLSVHGISSESFDASISGSGQLSANGRTGDLDASISGSGGLDLVELQADRGHVDISGSGTARVHVDTYLEASISGSGSLLYAGDPEIYVAVSGSGSARPLK